MTVPGLLRLLRPKCASEPPFFTFLHVGQSFSPTPDEFIDPRTCGQDDQYRSSPCHANEGGAPICVDTNIVAMLVDGVGDFIDNGGGNGGGNEQREKCKL